MSEASTPPVTPPSAEAPVAQSKASGRSWWAWAPAGLLTGLISIQAVLVSLAVGDPSFAVEEDYYNKAVNWDATQAQRAENTRLGFKLDVQLQPGTDAPQLSVTALDKESAPIAGAALSAVAFPNVRSTERQQLALTEQAAGLYSVPLRVTRTGVWEVRVTLTRGKERYTHTARLDIPAQVALHRSSRTKEVQ